MADESLITAALRARIGVPGPGRRVTLTPDLVHRVRETLADGPVEERDDVPPAALFVLESAAGLPPLEGLPPHTLVTGDEWEWRRPLRLGETLETVYRLLDAAERFGGRLGHALFLRHEWAFHDAAGEPAAFARRSIAHYAAPRRQETPPEPPPDAAPPADLPAGADPHGAGEGDPLTPRLLTPSLSQVVRYCGAAWNFVPIFYDPAAARAAGLPGTIVPGPLKLALLVEMVLAWAGPGAFLETIRAAHRRPDTPGRPLLLGGAVTRVEPGPDTRRLDCELWIENAVGARSAVGLATLRLGVG